MKIAIIDPVAGTTEESFARDSAYIRKYLADALEYVLGLCFHGNEDKKLRRLCRL